MKFKTLLFILVVLLLGARGVNAQTTPDHALLILAKEDNTLLIVHPDGLKVTAKLPVGPDPHEVIASPDGTTAYISNYGGGAYNTLSVVDLAARKVLPTIDLGPLRGPHGLALVGGRVWFTAEAAKVIASYDPATKRVDWIMGTGQNRTHMIYVSPDLNQIVTTNVSSASVSLIERWAVVWERGRRVETGTKPWFPSVVARRDLTYRLMARRSGSPTPTMERSPSLMWRARRSSTLWPPTSRKRIG